MIAANRMVFMPLQYIVQVLKAQSLGPLLEDTAILTIYISN